jgi:hypothetical protein
VTRVRHQIPIPDGIYRGEADDRINCAWADCDNPASGLLTIVECFANPGIRNHAERPRVPECASCRRVAFCSAQCQDYYVHSHRPGRYGRLSPGVNRRYF